LNFSYTAAEIRRVACQIISNVSEEHTASIFLDGWNLKKEAVRSSERPVAVYQSKCHKYPRKSEFSSYYSDCTDKGKAIPVQASTGPEGFRRLRLPVFLDDRNMKVASFSALGTDHFYPPGDIFGAQFR